LGHENEGLRLDNTCFYSDNPLISAE